MRTRQKVIPIFFLLHSAPMCIHLTDVTVRRDEYRKNNILTFTAADTHTHTHTHPYTMLFSRSPLRTRNDRKKI